MRHPKELNINQVKSAGKPISFLKPKEDFKSLTNYDLRKHEKAVFISRKKNRPISRKSKLPDNWNEVDAKEAIKLEQTFIERKRKAQTLIIHFPDERISVNKVKSYSKNIEFVKFIQSAAPRYCFITLKSDADVEEEILKISKIPFQNGFLKAKLHKTEPYESPPLAEEVDPATLYVGNLPSDVNISEMRMHFENAKRIDLGYSLKKKWRRYALVSFPNAIEARQAFMQTSESHIRFNSLIVRFHRVKHWKILEQIQMKNRNQIGNVKIKTEKEDIGYDEILERGNKPRVTQMAPASFPIARPIIETCNIKEEQITPPTEVKEIQNIPEEIDENLLDTFMQQHDYAMPSHLQPQHQIQQQHYSQQFQYQESQQHAIKPFDAQQFTTIIQQSGATQTQSNVLLQQQKLLMQSVLYHQNDLPDQPKASIIQTLEVSNCTTLTTSTQKQHKTKKVKKSKKSKNSKEKVETLTTIVSQNPTESNSLKQIAPITLAFTQSLIKSSFPAATVSSVTEERSREIIDFKIPKKRTVVENVSRDLNNGAPCSSQTELLDQNNVLPLLESKVASSVNATVTLNAQEALPTKRKRSRWEPINITARPPNIVLPTRMAQSTATRNSTPKKRRPNTRNQ